MDKNKKDFDFSKRAENYDEGFEGKFSRKFYDALFALMKLNPLEAVLDVGCGTGYLLRKISKSYEINGCGIDVEDNMVQVAKKQCPEMNIQRSSCEKTPFDSNEFDIVTACMAYHHFSDKKGFAKEAARILKTGGYLYIADPFFPFIIRKIINGLARVFRVSGQFLTVQEIANQFIEYGFELSDYYKKGYVQVVELKKCNQAHISLTVL